MEDDEGYMRIAMGLAKLGDTFPNPKVGCVIVKDGTIIGKGYHKKAGMPHAEIEAINDAQNRKLDIENATLFVTLEPCSSVWKGKRTPACIKAVLRSGVSRVVIAMEDPNPLVKGSGIELLSKKGISVLVGVLENEAQELNSSYIKWVKGNALCDNKNGHER